MVKIADYVVGLEMPMTPRQIIDFARTEQFHYIDFLLDGSPLDAGEEDDDKPVLKIQPGMSASEISAFEAKLPGKLPPAIRDLLSVSSGFSIGEDEVDFCQYNEWAYSFLLPHVIVLRSDGSGDSWVIEVNSKNGDWCHVWFECHDPPVLQYQCETLIEFIDGVFDEYRLEKAQKGHQSILRCASTQRHKLWRNHKRFPRAESLRSTSDEVLASFVNALPDYVLVIDLRNAKSGDGFDWSPLSGGPHRLWRAGNELLFAMQPKKGLLSRLFGR